MSSRVALVTGASSGIGESTAIALAAAGFVVYAAARRVEKMEPLKADGVRVIGMDVTDEDSMAHGVEEILAEAGRIDVLVNNAGYGSYGSIEDVPLDEARGQFEVNVFGAARLIQLVLPGMREQRKGTIINITSMGGIITAPFGGWYHSTKFALEGLSDCLRLELRPFGIDVVVVEPGMIKTEWGTISADNLVKTAGDGPYAADAAAVADVLRSQSASRLPSSPDVVAKTIVKAAQANRPRTRYTVGTGAKPMIFLKRVLPDRAWDFAITKGMRAM
ncbi:MAG: short-chain dehydrogenase/reductase [Gordonia sp.]|nr:short-chain dehydrogenase/reductase [Gordonia sp. (in: high G+C Gram-positive bacteria)]